MKRTLLLSASAIALTTGMATTTMAFEEISWDWKLEADTDINVDIDVDIKIDPAGATIVEVDQDFKGDLDAKATVIGVINNPDPDTDTKGGYGNHRWSWNTPDLDARTELPAVENVAAAIGNAVNIESQVSVQADINQSVSDNDHGYYRWGYGSGAEFSADATVALVVNASVDNAAQVVGNSVSITLDPSLTGESGTTGEVGGGHCYGFYCPRPSGGDGADTDNFLMANIVQDANFDGSATANVFGVYVEGYTHLSPDELHLNRPLVSNAAIAVGNTVSITVLDGSLAE